MATSHQINLDFLLKHEANKTDMYVPVCTLKSTKNKGNKFCYQKVVGSVIGNSGPTIGTGLDLGQQDEKSLQKMHLPDDLIKKLTPYLKLRKQAAKDFVEKNPLSLNSQQTRIINEKVKASYIDKLRTRYNSNSKTDFFDLPAEAQTAVFSFYYNAGWDNEIDFHSTFYKACAKQDWKEASRILNTAEALKSRRKEEAELFDKIK
jgi:GH24 family phage-related lysozyme (muramidase)